MKKKHFNLTRRQVLKAGMYAGAGMMLPLRFIPRKAFGAPLVLSNPADQNKFEFIVPDALAPGFKFQPGNDGRYRVKVGTAIQQTGLRESGGNSPLLNTPVWGYGDSQSFYSWPGRTFEVQSGNDETEVFWTNNLNNVAQHLLPVDPNLHWCYSLHGDSSANGKDYTKYSIAKNGVPIITHLHGGNTDFQFDGNPEFFYTPEGFKGKQVIGPQWDFVPGGFTNKFRYNNNVPAGNLWYHDHALGLTRLNVYAGLAGFYFVRDDFDTGLAGNPATLPAWPYEKAYAIQDRMFTSTGELFYPAYPGDPAYDEFIEAALTPPEFPDNPNNAAGFNGGGPTALAEFFGDHMVVNGKIWPKEDVQPRNYRMHLLNGCDSRFMVVRFREAATPTSQNLNGAGSPIPFYVVGSDQGLGRPDGTPEMMDTLVFEPGGRYDVVFDFKGLQGKRIIMENIGGDSPFGGSFGTALEDEDLFENRQTDRIMAFDVYDGSDEDDGFNPSNIPVYAGVGAEDVTRKVALFEGMDEFSRLQPLLGTVNEGNTATAYTWSQPTTETPTAGTTEVWEIYNFTGDAHPIHLHLVNFEILDRNNISFFADEDNPQQVLQHNGTTGTVPAVSDIDVGTPADLGMSEGYFESAPKDMVTVLPETRVRIRAHFDKPGRYVWHCHILSHEDHEMMRVLEVAPEV